ncbi:family 43 glycosylhydrolase [Virgibacillus ndiopensis]|uniref:family 43 glycosylhydrolase n=1 Tax=Virgibacillus ndiopensis TaxID=2004408 RepID=UPI000C087CA9|nr:family 43 glycosylhydrolase [Virgibacillus ndiopensis]
MNYVNPVYEPVLADPTIIKGNDGYYYAYGTEDAWGEDLETKLVPIVRSTNLVDWEFVGEAFEEKPTWKEDGNLWAPAIHYYRDKYFLYYSISTWGDANPGIGVAVSETPKGPFKDKGKVFTSKEIEVENSIDPYFILFEETPYMIWGSFHGIYGIELSPDGLTTAGEKFQIAGSDYEAPNIIERNDYFYFFGSRGSCCEGAASTYHVAVGRSKNVEGPYVDKDGNFLINNGGTVVLQGDPNGKFAGPGHNTIVTDDDQQDWIVYHAIDKNDPLLNSGATRRPLMLDQIDWVNDWPVIRDGYPSEGKQSAPIVH